MKKKKALSFFDIILFMLFIGIFAVITIIFFSMSNNSAEAERVITVLRAIKSTALHYYLDNPDGPRPRIDPDLVSRMEATPDPRYGIDVFSSDSVYAYCDLTGMPSGIVQKLKANDMSVEVVSSDTIARIRIR